ncbi:nucleoside hydrolase [Aestuariispira insulae]|uniref:Purine nucleosidase n=1 Tax=Aestuariispira insulae TaxID=1461337 RepID=A0A3D9HJL2_9PROT|nr:nucleoside hydrolase [Aestuariispira insulae]RED49658.1 purine nucleosidase [Aestuariispira insulae]
MSRKKVILDCDPGLDDAVAILMALQASEDIELLGITTVAGNVSAEATYRNARALCALAGREDVPVLRGCTRAIMGSSVRAEHIHGADGISGTPLPASAAEEDPRHAVDFLIEQCQAADDHTITICPVGPMTNLALAMIKEPAILPKIKQVVFMGGVAFDAGNCTPAAEFNIHADPHAAQVVLQSGIDLVMMGLDVTHKAHITDERFARIHALGSEVSKAVTSMLAAYRDVIAQRSQGSREGVLHDPCTIAYVINPDLFQGRKMHVEVDTQAGPSLGRTVADGLGVSDQPANVTVMEDLDDEGLYQMITEMLGRYK